MIKIKKKCSEVKKFVQNPKVQIIGFLALVGVTGSFYPALFSNVFSHWKSPHTRVTGESLPPSIPPSRSKSILMGTLLSCLLMVGWQRAHDGSPEKTFRAAYPVISEGGPYLDGPALCKVALYYYLQMGLLSPF